MISRTKVEQIAHTHTHKLHAFIYKDPKISNFQFPLSVFIQLFLTSSLLPKAVFFFFFFNYKISLTKLEFRIQHTIYPDSFFKSTDFYFSSIFRLRLTCNNNTCILAIVSQDRCILKCTLSRQQPIRGTTPTRWDQWYNSIFFAKKKLGFKISYYRERETWRRELLNKTGLSLIDLRFTHYRKIS